MPERRPVQAVRLSWYDDEPVFEVATPLEKDAIDVWLGRYVETHPSLVAMAAANYVQQIEHERAHPAITPAEHADYAAVSNAKWEMLRSAVLGG